MYGQYLILGVTPCPAVLTSPLFCATTDLQYTSFPNPYSTQAAGPCFWMSDHRNIFTITSQQTPTVERCKAVVLAFYMKINVLGDVLQVLRAGTTRKSDIQRRVGGYVFIST